MFQPRKPPVYGMTLEEIVEEGREECSPVEVSQDVGFIRAEVSNFVSELRETFDSLRGDTFEQRYSPELDKWGEMLNSGDEKQIAILTNQIACYLSGNTLAENIPLWEEYDGKPLLHYLYAILRPADLAKIDRIKKIDNGGNPCAPRSGGPACIMSNEGKVIVMGRLIGELDGNIHMISRYKHEIVSIKKTPEITLSWV